MHCAQGVLTPRGRIDGLGWVKPQEDENLENALHALTYPESNPGMHSNWVSFAPYETSTNHRMTASYCTTTLLNGSALVSKHSASQTVQHSMKLREAIHTWCCLQDPNLVSPALFSGAGASLGISPFQQALMNLTPNNNPHQMPRSSDGVPDLPA